jgi:hypothetical protein
MAKQRTGTSSRAVSISPSGDGNYIDSQDIAALAYQLWQGRGCPEGSPEVDWLEAEKQLRDRQKEAPAAQVSEPILVRRSGA